jgi:hypothetical protein
MTTKEYIESGILELYVSGNLDAQEMNEIIEMASIHPSIRREIEKIEVALVHLSSSVSPRLSGKNYETIKNEVLGKPVIDFAARNKKLAILGWAASILFIVGFVYQYQQQVEVSSVLKTTEASKIGLETEVNNLKNTIDKNESILAIIRDKNNAVIKLGGQQIAPESFAKIYWNQSTQVVYVDAAGLPEPPEGMVYQVWSLKLNPLTPTSIGLMDNFSSKENKIFKVDNTEGAEAFGITLEPAGGSPTPNLEQLYTLGTVS